MLISLDFSPKSSENALQSSVAVNLCIFRQLPKVLRHVVRVP